MKRHRGMRPAILLFLLCGLMFQPASARRSGRLRAMNDSLNAELMRSRGLSMQLQSANRQLQGVQQELLETERLLRSERAENARIREQMRAETRQTILYTALILLAFFGMVLWFLARNFSKNIRMLARSLESSHPAAPQGAKPAAVLVQPARPEQTTASGDNGRRAEMQPAPSVATAPPESASNAPLPIAMPAAAQPASPEIPAASRAVPQPAAPARQEQRIFWFTREDPGTGKVAELIELLRQRGIPFIDAGVITRDTIQRMEQGKFEVLLCAYEPRNEQGIMIDKNLQGVINALTFAGNLTPLIIFLDPKEQQISSWDQHMVNGYDFATVATSRLAFINQVVLSLQSARTAA